MVDMKHKHRVASVVLWVAAFAAPSSTALGTQIVYIASRDYIVAMADGYSMDDEMLPRALIGDERVQKLFPFGEIGIVALYGNAEIHDAQGKTLFLQVLIREFVEGQLPYSRYSACMGAKVFNENNSAATNIDDLVAGLIGCWGSEKRAEPVDLTFVYFDNAAGTAFGRSIARRSSLAKHAKITPVQRDCEFTGETRAPDACGQPVQLLPLSTSRRQRIGLLAETLLAYRTIAGFDRRLVDGDKPWVDLLPRWQKEFAKLAGATSGRQQSKHKAASTQVSALMSHANSLRATPTANEGIAVDYERAPLSFQCAQVVAHALVFAEMRLMEGPWTSILENLALATRAQTSRDMTPPPRRWTLVRGEEKSQNPFPYKWDLATITTEGDFRLTRSLAPRDLDACHAARIMRAAGRVDEAAWDESYRYLLGTPNRGYDGKLLSASFRSLYDSDCLYVRVSARSTSSAAPDTLQVTTRIRCSKGNEVRHLQFPVISGKQSQGGVRLAVVTQPSARISGCNEYEATLRAPWPDLGCQIDSGMSFEWDLQIAHQDDSGAQRSVSWWAETPVSDRHLGAAWLVPAP